MKLFLNKPCSFQLKLLKQEINRAEKGRKDFKEKRETDRSNFRENMRPELTTSVVGCIRREMRNHSTMVKDMDLMENLINCQRDRTDHCGMTSIVM